MADSSDRKPAQKRLSKQNEIDDEEEGEDNSPSSDQSDTTLTAGPDTPGIQSSPDSPTNKEEEEEDEEGRQPSRSQSSSPEQTNKNHSYSNSKGNKLQRSQALTEDDSPPPDESAGGDGSGPKHRSGKSSRAKLEKTGSGSLSSEAGTSSSLSRDSSTDAPYTDSSGIDLEEFIKMTLNRTPKDRQMLLQLEKDLLNFIQEPDHHYLKFPPMSSYNRMLVHRIAAFFGLDHNVDQTGKAVIVNKTSNTRVPEFNFGDHIRGNGGGPLEVPRRLLKRDGGKGGDKPHLNNDKRTKSLEERQYDYNQARARIFQQQDSDRSTTSTYSDHLDCLGKRPDSLSSSKEDVRWREMRPWSSTDSSGYSTDSSFKGRQPMTKASSFGGVPSAIMARPVFKGPSVSKTDSVSSGVSSLGSPMTRPPAIPSSPGNQSDASILSGSSSSGPIYSPPQPIIIEGGNSMMNSGCYHVSGSGPNSSQQQIYWVASNADSVPPGSIIINPQTGQPYVNQDGSLYRYHPNQPLPGSPSTPSEPAHPHPVYAQPTVIPVERPPYTRDGSGGSRELCHQMSSFTIASHGTEPVIDSSQGAPHAPIIYPSVHAPQTGSHSQSQVIMQQPNYYAGGQSGVSGPQVRYMYPVSYVSGPQSQVPGSLEGGQSHQTSAISQSTGQYPSQQYVVPYSAGYQGITYQQVPCQSSESFQQTPYPQAVNYPSAPTDSVQPHFSAYPAGHQLYNTQPPSYVPQPQAPQGPIYYTVPTSSPQPTFAFSTQGSFRPTTPPSQGSVASANPSLPVNLGQPVTLTAPAPPAQPPADGRLYGQSMTAGIRSQIQPLQFPQRLPSPQSTSGIPMSKPVRAPRRVANTTKQGSKEVMTGQLSAIELPKGSHVLEVCDLPPGVTQIQANKLLEDIVAKGATIQYYPRNKSSVAVTGSTPISDLTVLAIFSAGPTASQVLQTYSSTNFTLRSTLNGEPSITRPE
ncbi:cAMP-regulated phosphoprotein 21-like isoform X2 [Liolophura sinensis]|uniref:cAMP-regulated phosphoprotein 21-like isoform X2 n=1 Tax=Liolophura sinensis TaxID=3198878 RepID=UPI0031595E87